MERKKTGCISRAAMVTVIHVVDTLEQTQSLPASVPLPRCCHPSVCLSVSLGGLTVCLAGSRCSQLLQKKKPVIVTGSTDVPKPHFLPPSTTALITHSRPTDLVALTRPERRARTESGQTSSRAMNFFAVNPEPLMLMFIC